MTMTGFYWLLDMLEVFSGFPLPLCAVFMVILCGYQVCIASAAGSPGAPGAQVAPTSRSPLAFTASELVYPLLFPWYFGSSVHNA
jgi:apolipoprotein N-acyltransferase